MRRTSYRAAAETVRRLRRIPGMAGIVALVVLILLAVLARVTTGPPRPRLDAATLALALAGRGRRPRPAGDIRLGELETLRCPYCFTPIRGRSLDCDSCSTAHHPECFAESGRCAIYACGGSARLPAIARGAHVWRHVRAVE